MNDRNGSRRKFIRNYLGMVPALLGSSFLLAYCGDDAANKSSAPPASCTDLSAVSKEELEKRKSLGYVDETPIDTSYCGNCKLYLPAEEGSACGGCQLFKGPVEYNGYCGYFAPMEG